MPNGTLPLAGGVIRFAADSGCEPNINWGTIHEVRYGDQGIDPIPGPTQAANYNSSTALFTLGTRSPKSFAGTTTSSWTCDTQNPTVTVTGPNGGESWAIGTMQSITWNATDNGQITGITLEYSNNGGGSFLPIATGEANDGLFVWNVPNDPTTQALVRVTATDLATHVGQDVSDAVFTIFMPSSPDTTDPLVHVIRPNGGEDFLEGNTETIQWDATDNVGVTGIDLYYATDGGQTWKPIATGETNDGSYDWTVPSDPSNTARVRVVAHDAAANSGEDMSDADFHLVNLSSAPFIPAQLTAPVLLQNRPNPFNPGTFIGFGLPVAAHARLSIFAMDGRRVRTLVDTDRPEGYNQVFWDGTNDAGTIVASGVYFYTLEAGTTRVTKRMTLSK
jgi:hypothetical protein